MGPDPFDRPPSTRPGCDLLQLFVPRQREKGTGAGSGARRREPIGLGLRFRRRVALACPPGTFVAIG